MNENMSCYYVGTSVKRGATSNFIDIAWQKRLETELFFRLFCLLRVTVNKTAFFYDQSLFKVLK